MLTGRIDHPEDKHPEPYQQDLNPRDNAAQNTNKTPNEGKANTLSAYDLKGAHQSLQGSSDDELWHIRIVRPVTRPMRGATLADLKAEWPWEFTAYGDMDAGEGNSRCPRA